MAKDTAKILVQNRARRCRCSRPVAIQRTSSVAMKADVPMVKLGKMMWNITVKANWKRASRTGSKSIGHSPTGEGENRTVAGASSHIPARGAKASGAQRPRPQALFAQPSSRDLRGGQILHRRAAGRAFAAV